MIATATDSEVLDALAAEIDSIKTDTQRPDADHVTYAPEAWSREGRVD